MEFGGADGQGSLDGLSHFVGEGAHAGAVFCRQRADAAQNRREIALLAQILDLEPLDLSRLGRGRDIAQGSLLEATQLGAQAFEVHPAVPHLVCRPAGRLVRRLAALRRILEPPTPIVPIGTLSHPVGRGRVEGSPAGSGN